MPNLTTHDLITTDKAIVDGLQWQTKKIQELGIEIEKEANKKIRKIRRITKDKKENNSKVFLSDLIKDQDILGFLTTSLGYSEKKLKNLSKKEILREIKLKIDVDKIESESYLNHLKFQYGLTSGNSLGGKINNVIGKKGNELFCRYIFEVLESREIPYTVVKKNGNTQLIETEYTAILLNKKPKFINKSIDFIVLKKNKFGDYDMEDPESYISAGELKSGIDPAGADEHWKTATTALKRIHQKFDEIKADKPELYFIGGSISKHMAQELLDALDSKFLYGAANLSKKDQVIKIATDFLYSDKHPQHIVEQKYKIKNK